MSGQCRAIGGGSPRSQVVGAFTETTFVRMSPPDPAFRDSPPHAHCVRTSGWVQGRVLPARQLRESGRSEFVNHQLRRFPEVSGGGGLHPHPEVPAVTSWALGTKR